MLIPVVLTRHVIATRGCPVRALNKESKMRLKYRRKEYDEWGPLEASNPLLLGLVVLNQGERKLDLPGGLLTIRSHGPRED